MTVICLAQAAPFVDPLLPSQLPEGLRPPPRHPCYRHQGSNPSSSDLLSDVLTALSGAEKARVLLWGMIGIGKTAMACHIANLPVDPTAPQAWQGVLWTTWGIDCRGGLPATLFRAVLAALTKGTSLASIM